MAITVGQITTDVSSQLNDQGAVPFKRWSQSELVEYLNQAMIQVGNYRPDALTTNVTIPLVAGAKQTLPPGFSMITTANNNEANSNCPNAPVVEGDLDLSRAFFKKPCLPTGGDADYKVVEILYDSRDPTTFYASPPVPDSAAGTEISVTAVGEAPTYTIADVNTALTIPQKYYNVIRMWMKKLAYEVDTESETSFRLMMGFEKSFYNALGINYKQESLYKSGYYLGEKGTKDPQPSRH